MTKVYIHDMVDISDLVETLKIDVPGGGGPSFNQGSGLLESVWSSGATANHNTMHKVLAVPGNWLNTFNLEIEVRVKASALADSLLGIGIYAQDSGGKAVSVVWHGSGWDAGNKPSQFSLGYEPTLGGNNFPSTYYASISQAANFATKYIWLKLKVFASGRVEGWADNTNVLLKPSTYNRSIGNTEAVSMGNIVRIGVSIYHNTSTTDLLQFDNLQIKSNIANNPVGFDASIKLKSWYLRNSTGLGGSAKFPIMSKSMILPTPTTLKAQGKKAITFTDSFGNLVWKGEVSKLTFISFHKAEFEGEEILIKTKYVPLGTSPIIHDGIIRSTSGDQIIDKDAFFTDRIGVTTSHVVAFEKTDTNVMAMRPYQGTLTEPLSDTGHIVDNAEGDIDLLYFFDTVLSDALNGYLAWNDDNDDFQLNLYTYIFTKYLNTWDTVEIKIKSSLPAHTIRVDTNVSGYNYRTSSWETIWTIGDREGTYKDDRGGGSVSYNANGDRVQPKEHIWDLETKLRNRFTNPITDAWSEVTTYADNDRVIHGDRAWTSIQAGNTDNDPIVGSAWWHLSINDFRSRIVTASEASEFSQDRMRLAYRAADYEITGNRYTAVAIWEALTTVVFHNENSPEYGSTTIDVVDNGFLDLATNVVVLPAADGFGVGDRYIVSKSAKDYLEDAWAASILQANIGPLVFDVTGADTLALVTDWSNRSFSALQDHIDDLKNSARWYDYPNEGVIQRSADNLVSTGVTIQRYDISGWNDEKPPWSYVLDFSKERTKIRLTGKKDTSEVAISSEHSFDYGDETEIVIDASLGTKKETSDGAAGLAPKHTNAAADLILPIDFSNPTQSYTSIQMGKTIAVQLPTSDNPYMADYSSGGADGEELKILDREIVTDDRGTEITYLTLQRRNT